MIVHKLRSKILTEKSENTKSYKILWMIKINTYTIKLKLN